MPSRRRPERALAQLRRHLSPTPHPTPTAAAAGKPRLLYFKGTGKCYGVRLALFAAFGKDGWIDERISQLGEPGSHPDGVSRGPGCARPWVLPSLVLPPH